MHLEGLLFTRCEGNFIQDNLFWFLPFPTTNSHWICPTRLSCKMNTDVIVFSSAWFCHICNTRFSILLSTSRCSFYQNGCVLFFLFQTLWQFFCFHVLNIFDHFQLYWRMCSFVLRVYLTGLETCWRQEPPGYTWGVSVQWKQTCWISFKSPCRPHK